MNLIKTSTFLTILLIALCSTYSTADSSPENSSVVGNSNNNGIKGKLDSDYDPDASFNVLWYGISIDGTHDDGRQTIIANNLIPKMFEWGLPMHLIQFKDKEYKDSKLFIAPGILQFELNDFQKGSKYFFFSRNKEIKQKQSELNKGCGSINKSRKCDQDAIIFTIWGTLNKMLYDKDFVVLWMGGLVSVGNFDQFPTNTTKQDIHLIQDYSDEYDSAFLRNGTIAQMGTVNSIQDIEQVMRSYSAQTHQHLTLPDGSQT